MIGYLQKMFTRITKDKRLLINERQYVIKWALLTIENRAGKADRRIGKKHGTFCTCNVPLFNKLNSQCVYLYLYRVNT